MSRSPFTRRAARHVPAFEATEQLETRQVLATIQWTGCGDGQSLLDASNWEHHHLPQRNDTAVIDVSGTPELTLDAGIFKVKRLILAERLTVTGGTLEVRAGGTTVTGNGELNLAGGTFTGSGRLTVEGAFHWTGGLLAGEGIVDVAPGGGFTLGSASALDLRRDVLNRGLMVWTGGDIDGHDACGNLIVNTPGAVMRVEGEGRLRSLEGPGLLDNHGTLVRSHEGYSRLLVPVRNSGTLNVAGGTLQLSAGGLNTGHRNVAAGAVLHYFGDFVHGAGSTLCGGGQTIWQGGTHVIAGDWTVSSYLTLSNATVTGPGQWTIDGRLAWSHGRIEGPGGLLVSDLGKLTIQTEGQHVLARDVENRGVMIWNKGPLTMEGATITNQADRMFFVAADAAAVSGAGVNRIVNHGEMRKVLPTALDLGGVTFDSDGLVFAKNGSLNIPASVQLAGGVLGGGAWKVYPAGTLDFGGATIHTVGAGVSITRIGPSAGLAALDGLERNEGTISLFGGGAFAVAPAGGVFTNAGMLILNDATALDVQGDFEQTEAGTLAVGISNAAVLGSGRLVSAENAVLNGNVVVSLQQGFLPTPGLQFSFLSANSVQGQFIGLDSGSGDPATLVYHPEGVTLVYV